MSFTDIMTDIRDMVIQLQRSKNRTSEIIGSELALNSRMIQGISVDLEQLETMDVVLLVILAVGCISTITVTLTTYFLMKRLREQGSLGGFLNIIMYMEKISAVLTVNSIKKRVGIVG
jgi:hypothetical protein